MDYGNTLSRAWKITWNNKILWLFGFLAGLGTTSGGDNGGRGNVEVSNGGPGNILPPDLERQLQRPEVIAIVVTVACVLLVIGLALFALSIIGRGGLIGGIRLADDNGKVSFGEAWAAGVRNFWRMLGIQLVLLLAGLLIGSFGLLTGLIGAATLGLGLVCLLPILCLLVLALIPLGILAHFAQFGIVVDNLGVMDAFRKGWQVLKDNLGPIIILAIILVIIGVVTGLVLVAPFVGIVLPAMAAFILNPERPNAGLLIGSGLALLCYLPIAIVLGSILQTWSNSVWTLAYRQFTGAARAPMTPAAPQPMA
ncbi:MAG: hypothetical protein HYZ35_08230 [Chloroflexi bacterium]|nr:hypothetical protein [Chloroflexota bacterium]